ncbi:transcription termination factor MTEF18, mitochondrial-like [Triticum urartu]|uniref:Uncharacterized protein n=1 Tax=Triticum turgidum subsp. durum TaxID=4567 RepID=A0A9R0TQR9_TRITD|nr:transcription termination factor MTEF18, mitochondrial-like [Triticum urartu]VAI18368.1 unnamed protein product [Triticum turgidum subsp. durum]
MIRLRSCILTHLLHSPPASPISLRRLLSTTEPVPPVPANPGFAVEDYLVATCGLTRPQALKASLKLSGLKSPSKPDSVLALLAGLGLSSADVAALVAADPRLLCAKVDTLTSNVAGLAGMGMSRSQIAQLVMLGCTIFRCKPVVSRLHYYLPLFRSPENLLRVLKQNSYLLSSNIDKVVEPNVVFLRECGLGACDIAKLCTSLPRLLSIKPEKVRAMAACTESLGVRRGSGMFRKAMQAVAFRGEEKIAAEVAYLKRTFRWSDAEVGIAVCRSPMVLSRSEDTLLRMSEFLISEVGLEPAYIAPRSVMLCLSLEGRLRPRYYVTKFLKENGMLNLGWSYFSIVKATEKVFVEKFICPHTEAAPYLAEDYDAACRGEVPTNFRFA